MSLLLEALKRAALEKQQRSETEKKTSNIPAASNLALDVDKKIVSGLESSVEIAELNEEPEILLEDEFEELEIGEYLDLHLDEAGNQEAENDTGFELDLISEDGNLKQELDDKEATLLALEKAKQKSAQEKKDREHVLDQARLAQEQVLREQTEIKRRAEEEKKELARQQEENRLEEEQEKLKAKNLSALQDILKSGERIDQQAKRRSLVLYGALLFTAFLSIGVYYFFILKGAESHLIIEPEVIALVESNETVESFNGSDKTSDFAAVDLSSAQLDSDVSSIIEKPFVAPNTVLDTKEVSIVTPKKVSIDADEPEFPRVDTAPVAKSYLIGMKGIAEEPVPSEGKDIEQPEKVVIHKQNRPLLVARMVNDGYSHYQLGNYALAESLYWKVLNKEPKNKDAMLGLAAIATFQNRNQEALDLYHQILRDAPSNEYARAGILSLTRGQSSTSDLESELDDLLEVHPDTANLHFLKGANHANSGRWKLAQVSFFNAYINDSDNANYAYNLAISLDHLSQPNEALNFYRRALLLSAQRPASFSVEVIEQRIETLEQENI